MIQLRTLDQKFGALGSAVMFTFGAIAIWRWLQTDMLFFVLFALRDFLAAGFMFRRRDAILKSPPSQQFIAYLSSGLPLLYQSSSGSLPTTTSVVQGLLVVIGFTFVTLATLELGFQMGVSPANRGKRILTGVYRFLSHPMYVGYMIAELGLVLVNPITNSLLFMVSMSLYVYRARLETQILAQIRE